MREIKKPSDTEIFTITLDEPLLAANGFTPRQIDLLRLIAQGTTYGKQVATTLDRSSHTVNNLIGGIRTKKNTSTSPNALGLSGMMEKISGRKMNKSGWIPILIALKYARLEPMRTKRAS